MKTWSSILFGVVPLAIVLACGTVGSQTSTALATGQGRLAVDLIDAPSQQVTGIVVTIASVSAHSDATGWVDLLDGELTVDLLTLKTQSKRLGFADLPAGTTVDQIRLVLDPDAAQYVILADGSQAPLTIPSGAQSGIKLEGPFQVSACATHAVTLDFDGEQSVSAHPAEQGQKWMLRPVVRVKSESDEATGCAVDGGEEASPSDGGEEASPSDGGSSAFDPDAGDQPPATASAPALPPGAGGQV